MSNPVRFPEEHRLTLTLQLLSYSRTNCYLQRKISKILNKDQKAKKLKEDVTGLFTRFQAQFEQKSSQRLPPQDYARAIIEAYNYLKIPKEEHKFKIWRALVEIEAEKENIPSFQVSSYYSDRKSESTAGRAAGDPDEMGKKVPDNSRGIFLFFLARSWKKYDEVGILTNEWGWKVVRKCIEYSFPIRTAQQLSTFDRILSCDRVSLLQPGHVQSFKQKDDVALYGMEWLHFKCTQFSCLLKTESHLQSLPLFEGAGEKEIIHIGEGTLRIQRKLNIPEWAQVFHILFDLNKNTGQKNKLEQSPEFEYLLLVGPAEIESSKLKAAFLNRLLQAIRRNDFEGFSVGYKRDQDFHQAGVYTLVLALDKRAKATKEWKGAVPGLKDIFAFYLEEKPQAFSSEDEKENIVELERVLRGRLEFQTPDKTCSKPTLFGLIHGSIYVEGRTYFRFRKMWLQTSGEHYAITQEVFLGLLKRVYREDWPYRLPIPWSGVHDKGELTPTLLSKALGIKSGVKELFEELKKQEFSYLDPLAVTKVASLPKKLMGDILLNPLIQKYQGKIEEWLESTEPDLAKFIPKEGVDKVQELLSSSYGVLRDLQAGNLKTKNHEWIVIHPWLSVSFEWPEKFIVRSKEIEEKAREALKKLLSESSTPTQNQLKDKLDLAEGPKALHGSLPKLHDLDENYSFPDKVGFNPTKKTREKLDHLLQNLYHKHLMWKYESQYNQSYLDLTDVKKGEGWLTGDCVTPQHVELFDLIHYTPDDLLLYAVKEELGQKTREAISQLVVAAKKLRAALDHPQSKNIVDAFWDKAMGEHRGPNATYLNKLKAKLQQLEKKGFWELFTQRKITFVYACLSPHKAEHSLRRERTLRTFCTAEDLKGLSDSEWSAQKIYDFLIREEFLDRRGRLTAKFASLEVAANIADIPFGDEGPEKAHEITFFLKENFLTGSASIIAKLELLRAEKELMALGFNFAIVEIARSKSELEDEVSSSQNFSTPPPTPAPRTQKKKTLTSTSSTPAKAFSSEFPNQGFPNNLNKNPNITNICYVNAFVQIILNTPILRREVQKVNLNSKGSPEEVLSWICHEKTPPEQGPEQLRDRLVVTQKWPESKYAQQDVHELLTKFEAIFKDVKIQLSLHRRAEKNDASLSIATVPQLELRLELPDQNQPVALQLLVDQALNWSPREFQKGPWRCEALSRSFSKWEEKSEIVDDPPLLILQLIRHKYKNKQGGKINTPLLLPKGDTLQLPNGQYRITSIIFHQGDSLNVGHYMALVSWKNKGWYLCDDDRVTKLSEEDLANRARQSYLIICEKI